MAERDLLKAIDQYIQSESTGTAMVVFANNSLGRVYIQRGAPVSARYKTLEGMEALQACKNLDVRTVKFHVNTDIVRSRVVLRSNYEVVDSLNRPDVAIPAPAAVTQEPGESAQPAVTGPLLTNTNRHRLGRLLADYIGPVAPLVMADIPETVDIESALSIVSREIEDTQDAAEFVTAARQLLE